jgi:lysylphosphatidylglycerol synthetase-like protein (DUF2156 family)
MCTNESLHVNAAKILLEYYGHDSLSYFALNPKKKYFFSSSGKSFLSYAIVNKVALVSGDPIGPISDFNLLLNEFTFFVKGANLSSCFIGVQEKSLHLLQSFNLRAIQAGDEAVISLKNYKKDLLKKKVRRAESHINKLCITCEFYKRQDLPLPYLQKIEEISQEWLRTKGGKERGFSMTLGRIPGLTDADCEFVIALQGKDILGYLTFVPSYASQSLSLDTSRRKFDTPNGLMEFLLINAFDYYKKNAIKQISLNFATFHNHNAQYNHSLLKLSKKYVYKVLSILYKTDKLYSFNDKFLPEWNSRYVAFEKKRYIPQYLLAIAKTELNM